MRSLLNLFVISALGAGCTSGLWGPFAEDTTWNCRVTPCLDGQTCNETTGYCEGGVDMGTGPDMSGPAIFIKEETVWAIATNAYYHLVVADLRDDQDPEIFLSGDYLVPGNKLDAIMLSKKDDYKVSIPFTLPPSAAGQLITSVAPFRYMPSRPEDVVAVTMNANQGNRGDMSGKLLYIYKNGTMPTTNVINTFLPGYKSVAVGYTPDDIYPDIAVTSSQLPLVSQVVYPNNMADGRAQLYNGQLPTMRGTLMGPTPVPNSTSNGFSLVTLLTQQPADWNSGINISIAATRPNPGNTVDLCRDTNTTSPLSYTIQGLTDLALLVDMDNNSVYDLVLARMTPGTSALRVYFNTGTNMAPIYGNSQVTIVDNSLGGDQITALTSVQPLDFNNDGYMDLGVGMYQLKRFILLQNAASAQGGRVFRRVRTIDGMTNARSLAYDDMDGDTCKDLVALFGSDASQGVLNSEVKILHGTCP